MAEITYTLRSMNNLLDPTNVGAPDPKRRDLVFTEVLQLLNVDPSNSNSASLRPGRIAVAAGAGIHSGWSNPFGVPAEAYYVQAGNLWRLTAAATQPLVSDKPPAVTPAVSLIRTGLADLPMSFVQVNDVVRYSNGVECGVIEGGKDSDPFRPSDPFKAPMVAGVFEEFYNGRLYALIANPAADDGAVLICSDPLDVPGGIESMDTRHNVVAVYDGAPRGICRVDDGLYVSAGNETFYHDGDDAVTGLTPTYKSEGFRQKSVAPYGMIPGTIRPIKAEMLGLDGIKGWCCIWASDRGVCVGGSGGVFFNLTKDQVSYPTGARGTAIVREMLGITHYVFTIQAAAPVGYNQFLPRTVDLDTEEI